MTQPVVLSWSGGKDSMLALGDLRDSPAYEVVGLLTTITREHDRISMHGVRRQLLEAQAAAVGLPLVIAEISRGAGNTEYEAVMREAFAGFAARGVASVAFGDLFLQDIRRYRENLVASLGMTAVFPIWGRPTRPVATGFVNAGYRAIITCVDTESLDGAFAGRTYDHSLLADLPVSVDPCGENGEFHTFVTAGPGLEHDVPVHLGERVLRDGRFMFCDLTGA